jgi:hypothetical protein
MRLARLRLGPCLLALLVALPASGCGDDLRDAGAPPEDLAEVARSLIEEAVAGHEATAWTLADAVAWSRRELPDLAFAVWAARLDAGRGVDPEHARRIWDERARGAWTSASYASGSFLVDAAGPRPPGRTSSPAYEGPRPPTRDQWWESADGRTRVQWLFALFGEQSGLFDVGPREHAACPICAGAGLETVSAASEAPVRRLCLRCAGVGRDVTARFR